MFKKLIVLSAVIPVMLSAATPIISIPLNGNGDILGADGKKTGTAVIVGAPAYQPAKKGQGIEVKRVDKAKINAVAFKNLPAQDLNKGAISFWFKPNWKAGDGKPHTIIQARDNRWKFRFYLITKPDGNSDLSVCAYGQIQFFGKLDFVEGKWHHILFIWNTEKNRMTFFFDGTPKTNRVVPNAYTKMDNISLNLFCGEENMSAATGTTGEGTYSDFRIFNTELTKQDIIELAK